MSDAKEMTYTAERARMTPTQAKRAMLKPRKTRCRCGGTPGWYYVEDEGISVINENSSGAITFLSWRQIDQALALKAAAKGKSDGT
jgi:hypothetical protein